MAEGTIHWCVRQYLFLNRGGEEPTPQEGRGEYFVTNLKLYPGASLEICQNISGLPNCSTGLNNRTEVKFAPKK